MIVDGLTGYRERDERRKRSSHHVFIVHEQRNGARPQCPACRDRKTNRKEHPTQSTTTQFNAKSVFIVSPRPLTMCDAEALTMYQDCFETSAFVIEDLKPSRRQT